MNTETIKYELLTKSFLNHSFIINSTDDLKEKHIALTDRIASLIFYQNENKAKYDDVIIKSNDFIHYTVLIKNDQIEKDYDIRIFNSEEYDIKVINKVKSIILSIEPFILFMNIKEDAKKTVIVYDSEEEEEEKKKKKRKKKKKLLIIQTLNALYVWKNIMILIY